MPATRRGGGASVRVDSLVSAEREKERERKKERGIKERALARACQETIISVPRVLVPMLTSPREKEREGESLIRREREPRA